MTFRENVVSDFDPKFKRIFFVKYLLQPSDVDREESDSKLHEASVRRIDSKGTRRTGPRNVRSANEVYIRVRD